MNEWVLKQLSKRFNMWHKCTARNKGSCWHLPLVKSTAASTWEISALSTPPRTWDWPFIKFLSNLQVRGKHSQWNIVIWMTLHETFVFDALWSKILPFSCLSRGQASSLLILSCPCLYLSQCLSSLQIVFTSTQDTFCPSWVRTRWVCFLLSWVEAQLSPELDY